MAVRQLGKGDLQKPIEVRGPNELRTLGADLDWLRRRLVELETEKPDSCNACPHELKTPLSSIREGSELLREGVVGTLTSEQKEVAEILRSSSAELHQMIENLLRFGVRHEYFDRLSVTEFSLATLIRGVLARHRLEIERKQMVIATTLAQSEVHADREKLGTALDNLVGNALKFSPRGGVMQIETLKTKSQVIIEVSDSGPGVHREERERIFQPFYRGRAAQNEQARGSGIGLTVAVSVPRFTVVG